MKITTIEARDLNEAWFRCVRQVLLEGRDNLVSKGSFEGHLRREFDLVIIKIEKPGTRPLAPMTPQGVTAPATDKIIEDYADQYLMNPVKQEHEDYTYALDLAPQVEEGIRLYKKWGPGTNRICMTIGSPKSLFMYRKEERKRKPRKASSQCLRLVDTRILDGKLHFITYWRSWDLWSGFPVNLGGLQIVKEYMVGQIAEAFPLADGELIAVSGGLHLYDFTFDQARIVSGF